MVALEIDPVQEGVSQANWKVCPGNMHACDTNIGGGSDSPETGATIARPSWHGSGSSGQGALE